MTLNLDIAAELMIGERISDKDIIHDAIDINSKLISSRIRQGFPLPRNLPIPSHQRADKSILALDGLFYRLIHKKQQEGTRQENLISRLLEAKKPSESGTGKEHLNHQEIRDELATLLVTGHETVSSMISWAMYLLSQHPNFLQALREELDVKVFGREVAYEDLELLYWPKKILQETIRMYPPLASLSKEAKDADQIGGFAIPAKSLIHVCVYLTHHHPDFWKQPDVFNPQRFNEA